MRGMNTRQATKLNIILLALLSGLCACSSVNQPLPTLTSIPPTATSLPTRTPFAPTETPTPTPLTCLARPGRVEEGLLETTKPPQAFFIYLPPCYDENSEKSYPVLYLLHGQTHTADQWIRIGAVETLDDLILSGENIPFITVFPDDRYWNLESGSSFGNRLVDDLIPYIDTTYRTLPDRDYRAIGGMSRGAGWSLRLGLSRWDLFSMIGLHSLAVLQNDRTKIADWIAVIPLSSRPSIFMDIGDNDQELAMAVSIEAQFNKYGMSYEWHRYRGAHTEEYWSAHVEEYISWYAQQWNNP